MGTAGGRLPHDREAGFQLQEFPIRGCDDGSEVPEQPGRGSTQVRRGLMSQHSGWLADRLKQRMTMVDMLVILILKLTWNI